MMADIKRICSVEGCGKPARRGGICGMHDQRLRRTGSLYLQEKPVRKTCSVDGCDSIANVPGAARGLCGMHYQRLMSTGDVGSVKRVASYRGVVCIHDGCEDQASSNGLCKLHNDRLKNGVPLDFDGLGPKQRWISEHSSYSGDDCISWPFPVCESGRGTVSLGGKLMTAPRAMCITAHGEPPTIEHQAAHSCGNGHIGCLNPRHLSWKTPAENCADMDRHGTLRRGEQINTNVLSMQDVREIRSDGGKTKGSILAKRYGVTPSAISSVRNGRTWRWLGD